MDKIWQTLYEKAKEVQNGRAISDYVEAGGVAAAILSASGKIYVGVCVDTASTLGICAERNAIFQMITAGDTEIRKVLALMPNGKTGAPCGACRQVILETEHRYKQPIELILYGEEKTYIITSVESLLPLCFGKTDLE